MTASLVGIAALLLMAFLGFPLGFAMVVVGGVGFAWVRGTQPAVETVGQIVLDLSSSSEFSSLPLFMLMGTFVYKSRIAEDVYAAAQAWLGHLRGGLAMATVLACGGMAAMTGSSLATTATMARAAFPSMKRYGYNDGLAAGAIASGGTLGMLLPPSTSLLIYGILTNQNIGKLFIAGVIPGLILIVLFIIAIAMMTRLRPELVSIVPPTPLRECMTLTRHVWPVLALFLTILGGIYFGVFTASESGGIGAVGALLFALWRGGLDRRGFVESLVESSRTTAMMFGVGFGALVLNNFVSVAGLPGGLVEWIRAADLSRMQVILSLVVIYLVLGTVFDGIAMILLTVPVFYPVAVSLGIDPIWFGIFVTILAEISVISPPVGMNVFMLRTLYPKLNLWEIFNGTWPFFFADLVLLALIIVAPPLVLGLPGLMR